MRDWNMERSFSIATPYRPTLSSNRSSILGSAGRSALDASSAPSLDPRWEAYQPLHRNGSSSNHWLPSEHASDFLRSLGCANLPVVKVAPEIDQENQRALPQPVNLAAHSGLLPQHALRTELKTWLQDYLEGTLQEHLQTLPNQLRIEVKTALREVENASKFSIATHSENQTAKERERKLRVAMEENTLEQKRNKEMEAAKRDLECRLEDKTKDLYNLEKMLASKEAELTLTKEMHKSSTDSHEKKMNLVEQTFRDKEDLAAQFFDAQRQLADQEEHLERLREAENIASQQREQHNALMNELLVRKDEELAEAKKEASKELQRVKEGADRQMENMRREKSIEIENLLSTMVEKSKLEPAIEETEVEPERPLEPEPEEEDIETEWHELDNTLYVCVCPPEMKGVACYEHPDLCGDVLLPIADGSIVQPNALAANPECSTIHHGDVVRPRAASSHWLAISDFNIAASSSHTVYAPMKLHGARGAGLFERKESYDERMKESISEEDLREIEVKKMAQKNETYRRMVLGSLPETLHSFNTWNRNKEVDSKMAALKEIEKKLYRPIDPPNDIRKFQAKISEVQQFIDDTKRSIIGKGCGEAGSRGWKVRTAQDPKVCNEIGKVILQGSKYFQHIYGDTLNSVVRTEYDYDRTITQLHFLRENSTDTFKAKKTSIRRVCFQNRNGAYDLFRDGCQTLRDYFLDFMTALEDFLAKKVKDEEEKHSHTSRDNLQFAVKTCKPKHIFRILEKAAHRVGNPGDCSNVTDVIRSRVECSSCSGILNVLEYLQERSKEENKEIEIVSVKETLSNPKVGEWIDCKIYVRFVADPTHHICEIQLLHRILMQCCSYYSYEKALTTVRRAVELLSSMTGPRKALIVLWIKLVGQQELKADYSWHHYLNWTTENDMQKWEGVKLRRDNGSLYHLNLSNRTYVRGELSGEVVGFISYLRSREGTKAVNLSRCGHFTLSKDLTNIEKCWPDVVHIDLRGLDSLECDLSVIRLPSNVKKISFSDNGLISGIKPLKENFRQEWGKSITVVLESSWVTPQLKHLRRQTGSLSVLLGCARRPLLSNIDMIHIRLAEALEKKRCASAAIELSHLVRQFRESMSESFEKNTEAQDKHVRSLIYDQQCFITSKGLEVVALLARDDDSKVKLSSSGAHEAVISAMNSFTGCKVVQQKGCWALGNLCEHHHVLNQTHVGRTGAAMEAIVQAMQRFQHDQLVQEYACRAILSLSSKHPANQANFGQAGVCAILPKMLDRFSEDRVVQARGLQACYALANNNTENCVLLGKAGCCEIVVLALNHFQYDEDIRHFGCEVVANLAQRVPDNQSVLGEAGACSAVISVMRASPDNESVQKYCCIAVAALAKGNEMNQNRLIKCGADFGIKSALRIHTAAVILWASYAIYFLAKENKHNRDRLHDNGIRNVMDLATESLMRNDSDSNTQSKETKDALKWAKKAKAMIAPTLKSTVKRLTLHQAGTIFRQKKGLPSPM